MSDQPEHTIIPYPEFWDAARRQLDDDRTNALPSWHEFRDWILFELIDAVDAQWSSASHLPGRGDYRQVWHLNELGTVVYVIEVWRDRQSGVLELRDVVIAEAPPVDDDYEHDD